MHLENLPFNYEEAVAVLLFVIGFCMLLFSRNLIKKVIGLDIMDSGIFLLLADRGYIAGRTAPIIVDGVTDMFLVCKLLANNKGQRVIDELVQADALTF